MPFIIRDSSSITQRKRDKLLSGSFINRIQNSINPTTGSAPLLGISEQSIINTVKTGQMTQYQRNYGCVFINPGCPCNTVTPDMQTFGGWATRIGGTLQDLGYGITTYATDVYVTGEFVDTATIYNADGSSSFTLTSSGDQDGFIVKYNTNGTAQWATRIGGTLLDRVFGITIDETGVYVTGDFVGTATIYNANGSSTIPNLVSSGSLDAFIVKYNINGTAQWATHIGGTGNDTGISITIDATGVYITGEFVDTATIYNADGSSTIPYLVSSGLRDAFIVKYNTNGTAIWATRIGGTGNDVGNSITIDATGVYVSGYFSGTATIYDEDGSSTIPNLVSSGSQDAFIVKYNTNGTAQWATHIGGTGNDTGFEIATDATSVYVIGNFSGTATIYNADGSSSFTLTSSGSNDAFIVKYNKNGYC